MKNILSIFSSKKNKIIEELNKELAKANAKIAELETANKEYKRVNNQLGTALKVAEAARTELKTRLEASVEGRRKAYATIFTLRKEIKELDKKVQKRGKNGRFIKKNKE